MAQTLREFRNAGQSWWRKPLVVVGGRALPAELAILEDELEPGEAGAWLNSRGCTSGCTNLVSNGKGSFKPERKTLPEFVSEAIARLYDAGGFAKGVPDLVIWNETSHTIRFVEVKNPKWDRVSAEQARFHEVAREAGYTVTVAEWRFVDDHTPAALDLSCTGFDGQ